MRLNFSITTLPLRHRLIVVESKKLSLMAFFRGLRLSLRGHAFRILLAATTLLWFGLVINSLLFVHFLTYYVQVADSRALSLLQAAFYGCATLAIPLWLRVSKKIEKRWLFFGATIV